MSSLLTDLRIGRAKRIAAMVAIAAAGSSFGILSAQSAGAAPKDKVKEDKMVTICHATSSEQNPWEQLTINENALSAHEQSKHHEGVDFLVTANTPCPPKGPGAETPPDEGGDDKYRVCHATDDEQQWDLQEYDSNGDLKKDHETHEHDIVLEDGESCPDPIVPPKQETPVIVLEEVPAKQQETVAAQQQAAAAPQAQSAPSLTRRSCASRRSFRIRVRTRKADPVVRASVHVNGRQVRVLRGSRLTAPVRLTGLPKGRYSITIIAETRSGRTLSGVRNYKTCTPKSARRTTPKL